MSGLVSAVTKIFSSIGTGVAKLGSAVRAVGASMFTAGAATGTSVASAATGGGGGFLAGLGNTLTSMFKGVGNILTGGQGVGALGSVGAAGAAAPATAATGATGLGTAVGSDAWSQGFAKLGGWGSGLVPAATPTGFAPAGPSSATTGGGGFLGAIGNFLGSEGGAALIGGIGESLGTERQYELLEQSREADRQFLRDKEQRITDSYNVPMSALAGGSSYVDNTPRPKPSVAWAYNSGTGQIEKQT